MSYSFVLGGARSGKSTFAEQLVTKIAQDQHLPVTYLATSEATDTEMAERIRRHQNRRPASWKTVEEPIEVAKWLQQHQEPQVILIDCASLLLNNWLFHEDCSEDHFFERKQELLEACTANGNPIVIVSNEVGQGLVPPDPVSRQYRDWLGLLNQSLACSARHFFYVVAGVPIDVKKWQSHILEESYHE
jgi:adenosylcobinamide kinase / adenosylcobinamide-phosphate guanylyltransferase